MSYINRLVYKKHVSYLVTIDHFHLYSIISSLVQLTGELAGAFTTTPCSLATLKQMIHLAVTMWCKDECLAAACLGEKFCLSKMQQSYMAA